MQEAKKAKKAPAAVKPSFNEIISGASISGSWEAGTRATLAQCLEGGQADDEAVR